MPWNATEMMKKGARRMPGKAASMANAILDSYRRKQAGGMATSRQEGVAIATAMKHVNKKALGRMRGGK